ncbi:butyrate kinase [bacterium]|nr:butyrate kinase [bacterium]
MNRPLILVINPGSTSTRAAVYGGEELLAERHLICDPAKLAGFARVIDQAAYRKEQILEMLREIEISLSELDAIAARGAPLRSVPGGVYRINREMLADAIDDGFVEHASKVACVIANELSREAQNIPAFIVDPISTDEYDEISRISGLAELPRQSLTHALNMKRAARHCATEIGKRYEDANLIIAHLGGGCSIAAHRHGRMVDSVDANGEGPFSPERSGGLRVDDLARMVLVSGDDYARIRRRLTREGGLKSHLGTTDAKEVEQRVEDGDANARLVFQAMAYQMAKHICGLAAALYGSVDAVVLTGGLANSKMLTGWIRDRCGFLAPMYIYAGEFEMEALRDGVARALSGEEAVRIYPTGEAEDA